MSKSERGLTFFSDDSEFVQVGTWCLDNGRVTHPHKHNAFDRNAKITQEAVMCVQGSFTYVLLDAEGRQLASSCIECGDIVVSLAGGHIYQGLSQETRVLEFKNGPFLGVQVDKTLF